jgi:uncharacterized protein YndB with AHSA1/START domain
MAPIVHRVDIDRPPEEVFAFATDPNRFAEWQSDVVRASGAQGPLGARFTTVRRIGRTERDMDQQVTEFEPPRRWAAEAVGGAVRPAATVAVEPRPGGGSHVTFTLDFEAGGAGAALLPLVRRMAAKAAPRSYQRLKELLESG